jgi:DNA-binding IclR family transcriptional regulator
MLSELRNRRDELRPMVDELTQVESAITALEQLESAGGGGARRRAGRRRTAARSAPGRRRGRPPKGQPTRSDQFLALVEQRPGITISEAAQELGIEPNYLYRVSATLQREGSIIKEGRGFAPAVASPDGGGKAEVIEPPDPAAPEAVEQTPPPPEAA